MAAQHRDCIDHAIAGAVANVATIRFSLTLQVALEDVGNSSIDPG